MKSSSDNIENRTHDLPACSTVPQATGLTHTSFNFLQRPFASCRLNINLSSKSDSKTTSNSISKQTNKNTLPVIISSLKFTSTIFRLLVGLYEGAGGCQQIHSYIYQKTNFARGKVKYKDVNIYSTEPKMSTKAII
jgi:hypothetical protein